MANLRHLGSSQADAAYQICALQPERSAYIAGWIREGGLTQSASVPKAWLLGEYNKGVLEGIVYISATGIVIPLATRAAIPALVEIARGNPNSLRVLVGERSFIEELGQQLEALGLTARLSRDQLAYSIQEPQLADGEDLPLRAATALDLDAVVEASAAMAREEANDDPQARNPELFRARILDRIHRGRDFLHFEGSDLAFKTNVAALSDLGGQIEGIYTHPRFRGLGIGRRGAIAITRWVLARSKRGVLLVNEDNDVARRLYHSLGFREGFKSRTVFLGS